MAVRLPMTVLAFLLMARCALLACVQAAQAPVLAGEQVASNRTQRTAIDTAESAARRERQKILDHANELAVRLKALPDRYGKIYHHIEFAGELCKHDKASATSLFVEAKDAILRWQKTPQGEDYGESLAVRLHYDLMRVAARCDAKLPATLDPADSPSPEMQRAETLLRQAITATDESKKVELGRQGIAAGGAEMWERPPKLVGVTYTGPVQWLAILLTSPQGLSEELFLQAAAALRSAALADPRNIILLGGALFSEKGGYSAGGNILVQPWTADRASARPELAAAYLNAATDQVLRQTAVSGDKAQALVVTKLLLTQVGKYAPERAGELEALIEKLKPAAKGLANWKPPSKLPTHDDTEDGTAEQKVARLTDEQARGPSYLRLAVDLARDGKYDRAREIAAKIEAVEARRTLLGYIGVREAGLALDRGDFDTAEGMVERIPAADGRAVLLIALAAARAKSDPVLGFDTALAALREADAIADGRRGYFKLAVAQVLAQVGRKVAFEVLQQAINEINEAYSVRLAGSELAPRGFQVFIEFGPREEMGKGHYGYFSGSYNPSKFLEGVGDLGNAVERFAALDLDQTEGVCLTLADPDEQAEAIQALAAAWLRKLPPAPGHAASRSNARDHGDPGPAEPDQPRTSADYAASTDSG